jgi:hypothetical protein
LGFKAVFFFLDGRNGFGYRTRGLHLFLLNDVLQDVELISNASVGALLFRGSFLLFSQGGKQNAPDQKGEIQNVFNVHGSLPFRRLFVPPAQEEFTPVVVQALRLLLVLLHPLARGFVLMLGMKIPGILSITRVLTTLFTSFFSSRFVGFANLLGFFLRLNGKAEGEKEQTSKKEAFCHLCGMGKDSISTVLKGLIPLLFIVLSSCGGSNAYQGIPNVAVDLYIYPSDPLYTSISVVGGWQYVPGGSKGIIVYRNSFEEFSAYERHTPYDPEKDCSVAYVDSFNLVAVDSCSKTQYTLIDGSVLSGEGTLPLKPYFTSFDGEVLRITN